MAHATPLGRDSHREAVNELAEDAILAIKDQAAVLTRLERAQKNIERLQQARAVERGRLIAHVAHCKQDLREAENDLARYDEIDSECHGIHVEIMETLTRAEEQNGSAETLVAGDARAAGWTYGQPLFTKPGEIEAAVAKRRRAVAAGATQTEAEAI